MKDILRRVKNVVVILLYVVAFVYIVGIAKLPFYYLILAFAVLIGLTFLIYNKRILENRANFHYTLGDLDQAKILCKRAVDKKSENPLIYLNYSILLLSDGDANEA